MRNFGYVCSLGAFLALVAVGRANAGDDEARALVLKAIKAHGGEDNLAKIKAMTIKGTGKVTVGGDTFDFTADWQLQWPAQQKFVVEVTVNGMNFQIMQVLNGDKGWQKLTGAETTPFTKDELAENQHKVYTSYLQTLVPLVKDKAIKISLLGEVKVNDKATVGVCVTSKGQRDVNLYFDKTTHLLLKAESRISDQGNEVNEETLFSDYKAVDGVQQAHKLIVMRDGKRFVEADLSEVRGLTQPLDASIFGKP
jgi:hypothetical protein